MKVLSVVAAMALTCALVAAPSIARAAHPIGPTSCVRDSVGVVICCHPEDDGNMHCAPTDLRLAAVRHG
jgi:hypothetical protein